MKILLADDEPDILELLAYNLKKEGYEVLTTTNGVQALEVARVELPDVIILDIMMPLMDGVMTYKSISPGLDQAVINLIKSSPRWPPGKTQGQKVRARWRYPIKINPR